MEKLEIGGWALVFDPAATRAAYQNSTRGAHDCTCVHCRNFIAVRDSEYPRPFTELLARLGISTDKEAEIYEIGPGDNATRAFTVAGITLLGRLSGILVLKSLLHQRRQASRYGALTSA